MSIQTVAGLQNILKSHDAKSWSKSASVEGLDLKSWNMDIPGGEEKVDNRNFSELLADSIAEVNQLQQDADKAIQRLATGKSKNIHETMLAVEKAEIAFKTMNQIRMKVIDAYKEVMRMQV